MDAFLASLIKSCAKKRAHWYHEWFTEIATWFSYTIQYSTAHKVSYDSDPPWDCSGRTVETGSFDLSQYKTFKEFQEEYTGNTKASYMSGCGFFHETYEEELLYQLEEFFSVHVKTECKRIPTMGNPFLNSKTNSKWNG